MAVSTVETLQANICELQKTVIDLQAKVDECRLSNERVVVMIDRSNLEQTWRRVETSGNQPDYIKLQETVGAGRAIKQVRIYYSEIDSEMVTDAERPDWSRRQNFYTFLRHQGWVLRGVKKKMYDGVPVEKGLDGCLIRDMEIICRDNRCDTIVLVAGDADYCDVVGDVQERYCVKVEVAFFPNQTARDLSARATKFVNLEQVKDRIVRRPNPTY